MIRTKSWNSPLDIKYDKPNAPQEPIPRALNPACPVSSASGYLPRSVSIIGRRSADEEHTYSCWLPSTMQPTQSQRCTISTAARIRQAKFDAAQRLAGIEMLRLQLEAELVHKKLEADIAILRSSEGVSKTDRLRHVEPAQRELSYDSLPARDTRTPLATAPSVRPVTNNTEPKPERHSKDTGIFSSTVNHWRTESHSQDNNLELLRPAADTLALKINEFPRPASDQNYAPTTGKVSSATTYIFDQHVLTGSRNEPAASRIELSWVILGTAPRVTTSTKDDHHVLHLRAENRKQAASHEFSDALAQPLEGDAESVPLKPIFYATMQKEDTKEETNQLEQAAQFHLPTYYNTRGVRTYQLPFCNIRGQVYTAKVPLGIKTVDQEEIHHLELAIKRSCHLANLDPTLVNGLLRVRGRLDAVIVSYPAKRPILSKGRRLFSRLQLVRERGAGLMNNKRTVNNVQQKCWAMNLRARGDKLALKCFTWRARRPKQSTAGRLHSNPRKPPTDRPGQLIDSRPHYWVYDYLSTLVLSSKPMTIKRQTYNIGEVLIMDPTYLHLRKNRNKETRGGVFHRTMKKLAVLTRNMKLRESFAEGRMLRTGAYCLTQRRR